MHLRASGYYPIAFLRRFCLNSLLVNFSCPPGVEDYPNLHVVKRLVDEWQPQHVEGKVELMPEHTVKESVSLRFSGTVDGAKASHTAWSLNEILLQHPALAPALEVITGQFLASTLSGSISARSSESSSCESGRCAAEGAKFS